MGCRCTIVSQMFYHRCVAKKPVVCEFSTRFLFCEGCIMVKIAIYVLLTSFGFLLLCSWLADGAGPWTVNTSVICNQTLCNFVMEGDRGCVPIFWEAELLSPTLPTSLLTLPFPYLHLQYFQGGIKQVDLYLGSSLHSTQRSSHCLGLVILAAKHLAKTCSISSKFYLMTFHWDGLRKYVLLLFFKKSQSEGYTILYFY